MLHLRRLAASYLPRAQVQYKYPEYICTPVTGLRAILCVTQYNRRLDTIYFQNPVG